MASRRLTAVSAVLLTIGLSGAAAVPFLTQGASAAVVGALDPGTEEGCVDWVETCSTPGPTEVTTTITTTLPQPTPTEVTVTQTVTATPTKTKAPKTKPPTPTPTPTPQVAQTTQPPVAQIPPPVLSSSPAPSTAEPEVSLPALADDPTPSPGTIAPVESSEQNPLELKNAQPEVDQYGMTQKLAIPALVLVLLALFGVLVFEGRLRRMAHAAAVRKAGPQVRAEQAYPVGQGFAGGPQQAGYPGNTAYAPIISLVPVQTYPTVHMPYGPVYQDPYGQQAVFQQPQHHPGDPAAGYQQTAPYSYPQQPVHHEQPHFPEAEAHFPEEPPYVPPVEEERPREEYRDLFEPAVPASVEIPPGGDAPYREPHAPALGAEHGDPLPWEAAGDEGTVIYPLPGGVEDETVERRRPEPPAGEQRG